MRQMPVFFLMITVLLLSSGCQMQNQSNPSPEAAIPTIQATSVTSQPTTNSGYPAPQQTQNGYPPPSSTSLEQTAFQAYPIAEAAAKKWNKDAVLYQIPATFQMEINFGHSATGIGWFFMFKVADSPLEYYVFVNKGAFGGATEAQPIIFNGQQPAYQFQPLPPLDTMLDSDKIVAIYMKNGGDAYLKDNPKAILNLQLNYLQNDPYPIWRIFDASKIKEKTPLITINALNGEIITNN